MVSLGMHVEPIFIWPQHWAAKLSTPKVLKIKVPVNVHSHILVYDVICLHMFKVIAFRTVKMDNPAS